MRILVHDYAGHPFQVQLSRELARRGHQVTHAFAGGLVTPRGALTRQPEDPKSFDIVEVAMSKDYAKFKYSFVKRRGFENAYGDELVRLVRRIRPDVVLSGNTPTEPQWKMLRAAKRQRVAFVSWVQDFYSIAVEKLAKKKLPIVGHLAGRYYRFLDALTLRKSEAVVSITSDFTPILEKFGAAPESIVTIPNWAPLEELPPQPRQNPWSAKQGLNDKFVFQYSGTLAMKHNPDLLLQLAIGFRDDPEVRVVVISEGPGADWLKASIARHGLTNMNILPFQPFAELPDVMASSEVLVAILEPDAGVFSVPSKVLTYHCAGRPILGAMPKANLAARTIERERTGVCVDPSSTTDFVREARKLRASSELRTELGKTARLYAETAFDINAIATRFEEVSKLALDRAASAR